MKERSWKTPTWLQELYKANQGNVVLMKDPWIKATEYRAQELTTLVYSWETFYKTPVLLKAVKVLKTREVRETAQPGGALGDKKEKM